MIARALVAAVVKDVRLLVRDRVGLAFLTIAPLIVMSVAGFSLSTLSTCHPRSRSNRIASAIAVRSISSSRTIPASSGALRSGCGNTQAWP